MLIDRRVFFSASEERLGRLIEKRLEPNADKEVIDNKIWDLFGETWAVMFTDLSGFSKKSAEFGIIHFLQTIYESERILIPIIEEYDGVLLKKEGDSLLIVFRNVNKAVQSAIAMQRELKKYNETKSEAEEVLLCLGIGYGKLLKIGDTDVFGEEVNFASKLGEDSAEPWEILVTESVKNAVSEVKDISYETMPEKLMGRINTFKVNYEL